MILAELKDTAICLLKTFSKGALEKFLMTKAMSGKANNDLTCFWRLNFDVEKACNKISLSSGPEEMVTTLLLTLDSLNGVFSVFELEKSFLLFTQSFSELLVRFKKTLPGFFLADKFWVCFADAFFDGLPQDTINKISSKGGWENNRKDFAYLPQNAWEKIKALFDYSEQASDDETNVPRPADDNSDQDAPRSFSNGKSSKNISKPKFFTLRYEAENTQGDKTPSKIAYMTSFKF